MFDRKYRAFHNTDLHITTVHDPMCSTFLNRNPNTEVGTWQLGTRSEIEAKFKELGQTKIKDHTSCGS